MSDFKIITMVMLSSLCAKNLAAQITQSDSVHVYHSIGEALAEPEKVEVLEVLNISDADSLELLTRFVNLKSLSLIDYHGTTAPVSIAKLTGLRELRFIKNDFYFVPDAYKNLVNLERVEFIYDTHLNLQSAFNFISNLPTLTELRIEGLSEPVFPDLIVFPKHLKILSLRNNHLNALPQGLAELKELELLDVGNNELLELPSFLSELNGLNTIYLDQQPYLRFDQTFEILKKIPSLSEVHLEGNHLSRETIEIYTREVVFKVFLDEDHAALTRVYQPHINLKLPPMSQMGYTNQSGKFQIPINRTKN
jgi:Leucine-rich repeat (LRR) protein